MQHPDHAHNHITVALDDLDQELQMNIELVPAMIRGFDTTIKEQTKILDANAGKIDRLEAEVTHLKQNLDCFRGDNERLRNTEIEHKRLITNFEVEISRLQKKKKKPLWLRVWGCAPTRR